MAFYLQTGIKPFFKKNLVVQRIVYNSLLQQNETQINKTPYFLKHFKFLLQEDNAKNNENQVNELSSHDHKSFLSKSLMFKNLMFTPNTSTQFSLALLSFKNLLNKTYNLATLYNNAKFITWFKTPEIGFNQNTTKKFSCGKCSDKKPKKPKCNKKKCKPKKKTCGCPKPKKTKKPKCDLDDKPTCKKEKKPCPEPCPPKPKPCGKKKTCKPKNVCKPKKVCKKKEPKKTCKKPCKKPKKKCEKPCAKKKTEKKPCAQNTCASAEPKPCGKPKKPKCDAKKKCKKKSKTCEKKSDSGCSCPVKAASTNSCSSVKTPPPDITHMRANSGKKSSNKDKVRTKIDISEYKKLYIKNKNYPKCKGFCIPRKAKEIFVCKSQHRKGGHKLKKRKPKVKCL